MWLQGQRYLPEEVRHAWTIKSLQVQWILDEYWTGRYHEQKWKLQDQSTKLVVIGTCTHVDPPGYLCYNYRWSYLLATTLFTFNCTGKKMKGFKWQGSQDNLHTQRPRPPPPPNTGLTNDQTAVHRKIQHGYHYTPHSSPPCFWHTTPWYSKKATLKRQLLAITSRGNVVPMCVSTI